MISYSEILKRPRPPPPSLIKPKAEETPSDDSNSAAAAVPGLLRVDPAKLQQSNVDVDTADDEAAAVNKKKRNKKKPTKNLPSFSDFVMPNTPPATPTTAAKHDVSPLTKSKQPTPSSEIKVAKTAGKSKTSEPPVAVPNVTAETIPKHKGRTKTKTKRSTLRKIIDRERAAEKGVGAEEQPTADENKEEIKGDQSIKEDDQSIKEDDQPIKEEPLIKEEEPSIKEEAEWIKEPSDEDVDVSRPGSSSGTTAVDVDFTDQQQATTSSGTGGSGGSPKKQQPPPQRKEPPPFSMKFRSYATNVVTDELNTAVHEWLQRVKFLHDRLHKKDPVKARTRKRLVCGLHQVKKELQLDNVKVVVAAPNMHKVVGPGGLDEQMCAIKRLCDERSIAFITALNKHKLGYAVYKPSAVVVAVCNYDGAEPEFAKVREALDAAREQLQEKLQATAQLKEEELNQLVIKEESSLVKDEPGLVRDDQSRSRTITPMANYLHAPEFVPRFPPPPLPPQQHVLPQPTCWSHGVPFPPPPTAALRPMRADAAPFVPGTSWLADPATCMPPYNAMMSCDDVVR